MNLTHLHLLITHLPIFGSILGGLVLAHGIYTKSIQTKMASYNIFIISSIGAVIAYLTGEAAEHSVEDLPGVIESAIKQHENFALISLVALIVLGLAAIVGFLFTIKRSLYTKNIAYTILIISLISFGLIARTGYLGGQIRHTEISANSLTNQKNEKED